MNLNEARGWRVYRLPRCASFRRKPFRLLGFMLRERLAWLEFARALKDR
jgi:hypothetical protein